MHNEDLWNYSSAGPESSANRRAAQDVGEYNGIRRHRMNGMMIVDNNVSRMSAFGAPSANDLLTVPKQIGNFFPMLSSDSFSDTSDRIFYSNYQSRFRDRRIFNEEHSRMEVVKYSDALRHCLRWDQNGDLDPGLTIRCLDNAKDEL